MPKLALGLKGDVVPRPMGGRDILAKTLVQLLADLGVEHAFGVSGGAIALLFDALAESEVSLYHTRHETNAAYAACEASLASGRPTVVFTTTGPGLLNALTGMAAAKWDGAKVILVSGSTNAPQRGRWATQESSGYTLPQDALYGSGPIFDFAVRLEHTGELSQVAQKLHRGMARASGFVAHIGLPISLQSSPCELVEKSVARCPGPPMVSQKVVAEVAHLLKQQPFVIWLGHGARSSSSRVRKLVELSGAEVICSPRGKGIVPEDHPQFLGVSGRGGHRGVAESLLQQKPKWILVLGSRLGEATSFWDPDLMPTAGFIHVDVDPKVPGTSFPDARTLAVHAEINGFLAQLLKHFPAGGGKRRYRLAPASSPLWKGPSVLRFADDEGPVRPQAVMTALQRRVVEQSDAMVLGEGGDIGAWTSHYLSFDRPGRYRVSTHFDSMGHMSAGVVGAAIGSGERAVAVVGETALLMCSEVSTAAQYGISAVWVVINEGSHGHRGHGQETTPIDFVELALALGADGCHVKAEQELDEALDKAMSTAGPYVVDVRMHRLELSPLAEQVGRISGQRGRSAAEWLA